MIPRAPHSEPVSDPEARIPQGRAGADARRGCANGDPDRHERMAVPGDWKERFYPIGLSPSRWLEHYATHFTTVEVNNSFCRLPSREVVARWAHEVPKGFVLTLKASRYITHVRRLREPQYPIALLWDRAGEAGDRLGPILFQLPPDLHVDVPRLETFVAALPGGMRAAFEFRHGSWFCNDAFRVLDRSGCALVWADHPGSRVRLPATGGWAYLRFHQGRRTGPGYPRAKLRQWAGSDRAPAGFGGVRVLQQRCRRGSRSRCGGPPLTPARPRRDVPPDLGRGSGVQSYGPVLTVGVGD